MERDQQSPARVARPATLSEHPGITRLAFVGLGQLGIELALLAARVFPVVGVDPSESAREKARRRGLSVTDDLTEALSDVRAVLLCLPTIRSFDEVIEAGIEAVRSQRAVLDHVINLSTVGPERAVAAAARLQRVGVGFAECPVTGGVLKTRAGLSTILCGTDDPQLGVQVSPIVGVLGSHVIAFARVRDASIAKLVNNVAAMNIASGTLEAIDFGLRSGLRLEDLFDVLEAGTATSYILSSALRRALMEDDEMTGFAARLAAKDLELALEAAESSGAYLPVTSVTLRLLREACDRGLGDLAFPAMARVTKPPG